MSGTKISAGADPVTVVATDKVPMARSASTTAYAATVAELATYANSAYVPNYYTGTPSMDATAAAGTAAFVSRGDHVHPVDTSRYAASNPAGYVSAAAAAAGAPVQSVATRTGAVVLTHTDITDWTATLAPYAPLASPALTGTPTAPTAPQSTVTTQIATTQFARSGTATNDNAAGGIIGEYLISTAGGGAMVTGTNANVASLSLTAGDWDVWARCQFAPGGAAAFSALEVGISTTSAAFAPSTGDGGGVTLIQAAFAAGGVSTINTGVARISIAGTTTVYAVGLVNWTGGTGCTTTGYIIARRAR